MQNWLWKQKIVEVKIKKFSKDHHFNSFRTYLNKEVTLIIFENELLIKQI